MTQGQTKKHKIIVGGTGRTGSTVFMALCSYLELGTGYDKNVYKDKRLYKSLFLEGNERAYIMKDHERTARDINWLNQWDIDYYIWLKRFTDHASGSRIKRWKEGRVCGGLTYETRGDPTKQLRAIKRRHYAIEGYLKEHPEIPFVDIVFPRFVYERDYLFEKMTSLFPEINRLEFEKAFDLIIKPDKVHIK